MTTLFIVAYVAVILFAVADQGIKLWVLENLQGQPPRPFLKIGNFDWMHLNFVQNDGAAFSIFSGSKWFLIGFSALMTVICLIVMQKLARRHHWMFLALPLIAGGGLGNLYDRIFRDGLVVDYLDFQLCNFAIFNFADICVTMGVIIMAFCILFVEKEEPVEKKARPLTILTEHPVMPNAPTLPDAELAEDAKQAEDVEQAQNAEELPDA